MCGSYWYSEVLILSFDKMYVRPDFKVILYSDENLAFFPPFLSFTLDLLSEAVLSRVRNLFCITSKCR